MPATSLAWKPRTSRRMSTASWRGGRICRAVTKAREMDFGLLVAGLRAERHVDRPLEQGVGEGLEPHDLAEPGRLGRLDPGDVPLLGRAPAGRAERVEAPVGGDPVQPGADRGAPLEPAEALPGGQQRVLQGVLGVLEGAEHPVAVHLQLPAVRLGQLPERLAVPGPRPGDQVGCHHFHPRATSLPQIVPLPVQTPAGPRNWALAGRPVSRRRGVCLGRRPGRSGPGTPAFREPRSPDREVVMSIEGKSVLVTGANRGIGQALVTEALRRGASRVYAGTRQPLAHPDGRVTPLTPGRHRRGADPGGGRAGRVSRHPHQ